MKLFLTLFFLFHALFAEVQAIGKKSFDNLTTIKKTGFRSFVLSDTILHHEEVIFFDKKTTTVINRRLSELDKSDPFFYENKEHCEGQIIKLIRTKIDNNSDKYYTIVYDNVCGSSSGFTIYEDNNPKKEVGYTSATRLFVPGTGAVFGDGWEWGRYNERRKYALQNDTLIEVKQPFKYVGFVSTAKRTVKLFSDKELKNLVATIPTGYEIEVILHDTYDSNLYLVRTSFGIIGMDTHRSASLRIGRCRRNLLLG